MGVRAHRERYDIVVSNGAAGAMRVIITAAIYCCCSAMCGRVMYGTHYVSSPTIFTDLS